MQARPSPRRPLVSRIDDGGSMPVPDGRMRGIRSIREHGFLLGRVRSWPESTVCSHQSAGLPSPSNRRTRRVSMLSILPISNAARWNCHDGTNRSSRSLCIRQQLRAPAGPILCAASAHSRRRAPSSSAEREARLASRARSGKACRTGGCGDPRGQPGAQERRAARHGLCRPPVRDFRTSTR